MSIITRFAGNFNAADYSYGSAGAAFPGPLVIGLGNTSTGAQTVQVNFGYTTLQSGETLLPLATTAPITVGSGPNAETVTPSAVSQPTPGVYDTASITATFNNLHGQGDPVSSATFGLQEAINACHAYGGGSVITDAKWAALGGSNAIIAAATVPSGVTLVDNRSGGASLTTQYATVNVAAAAVKTLNATPVQIVAAQGAGTFVEIISIIAEHIFATGTFTAGSTLQAYFAGTSIVCTGTIATGLLAGPVANEIAGAIGTALAASLSSDVLNVAVNFHATSTEYATGSGSLRLQVRYVVHTGL